MSSTSSADRVQIIDVIRGITLLGIILVHFAEQYYAGPPPEKAAMYNMHHLADEITMGVVGFFISGKFFAIFSFLFGLSFFLQFSRSEGKAAFYLRFLWRLIILFAIGWLHHLHYRGDILTIYALLGVPLLVTNLLPDKALLTIALILALDVPAVGMRAYNNVVNATSQQMGFGNNPKDFENYYNTLKGTSYTAILRANVHEFSVKMGFQLQSGRLFITAGLFMLGLYAGRKRFFHQLPAILPSVKKLRNGSLWAMLGVILLAIVVFGGTRALHINLSPAWEWTIGGFVYDAFNLCQACFYFTVIILLYQKPVWQQRLNLFYEVGRIGLTTYVMQTAFGVLIFFGFGLNLLGQVGTTITTVMALFIFVLQIVFARRWFASFYYGPIEWAWRSLTLLKWQPFLRKQQGNQNSFPAA